MGKVVEKHKLLKLTEEERENTKKHFLPPSLQRTLILIITTQMRKPLWKEFWESIGKVPAHHRNNKTSEIGYIKEGKNV